ncbi:hypothetical protein GOP47_0008605 [Adiantum capillus-veneris]|uniref:RRM domain-containing protein n=1 Tax=Adiantum capillus-veneris TaxID=13818 RepID=A0A9D4ZKW4_ADICA|nr:hypothetical protein GOP47_0008605 [Adiantum capillus-veneris]
MGAYDMDAMDFVLDVEDDLLDEDTTMEEGEVVPAPVAPKLKSTITSGTTGTLQAVFDAFKKTKGRGFGDKANAERSNRFFGKEFESLYFDGGPERQKSIEGWIIMVTGLHEEDQEDDLHEVFSEFGEIKNLHLNLDRRTGYWTSSTLQCKKKVSSRTSLSRSPFKRRY